MKMNKSLLLVAFLIFLVSLGADECKQTTAPDIQELPKPESFVEGESLAAKFKAGQFSADDVVRYIMLRVDLLPTAKQLQFKEGFIAGYGPKGEIVFRSFWEEAAFLRTK